MNTRYLIWSHEHRMWWGPGRCGYTDQPDQAGRYSRVEAMAICTNAIAGTAQRIGALPELPVLEADLYEMRDRFRGICPGIGLASHHLPA